MPKREAIGGLARELRTLLCPECTIQVEVVEGRCPLGHAVISPVSGALWDVRREVDNAFAEADIQVSKLLETVPVGPPQSVPAPDYPVTLPEAAVAPIRSAAPPPPPPPPPPAKIQPGQVWAGIEHRAEKPAHGDPIQSFAPPPSMDWGPEGSRLIRRLRARKTA